MRTRFYKTATLVTGLSVAERTLGFLYRMILARMVGAEGLGIYQVALSVYAVFITISGGGIPPTVSRLISKSRAENDLQGERKAVSAGVFLALALSLPVVLLFFLSGNLFSFLFHDKGGLAVFRVLLIGLVFCSVYGAIRAWFWGQKQFLTSSMFGIIEESVAVITGVLLLKTATTTIQSAEFAALSNVLSHVVACGCAFLWFYLRKGKLVSPKGEIKNLLTSATPITAVRTGGSLVGSAVAVLLPVMLVRAGMTQSDALKTFGIITGMVMPALSIVATVIGSFALVLVPELSEDYYANRQERLQKNIDRGLTASALVACLLMPFFFVLGESLGLLAYSSKEAGEMIVKSCPILLPMSLAMISTSILNAMGFEKQTFGYYFIGAAFLLACICFLPALLGGYAYIIGIGGSYAVCTILNLRCLFKKVLTPNRQFHFFKKTLLSIALILPVSFVGQTFKSFFTRYFSEIIADLFIGGIMLLVSVIFYFLMHLITANPVPKPRKAKNR